MKVKINKWIMGLCVLSILLTFAVYNRLPDQIPRHWNIQGEVDAYMSRSGALWMSLMPLGIYLMMVYLPLIDPKRKAYDQHQKAYAITQLLIVVFLVVIQWSSNIYAMGYVFSIERVVVSGIGIMFIIMGNYMTQIRQNFFFGIKTPWTLSSETVWRKTHRLGGYLFMLSGVLTLLTMILQWATFFIMTITIVAAAVIPIVYSYILFKKEMNP